jgi:ubiquinone/menaquinone biosynthesis C-methylase UbiE
LRGWRIGTLVADKHAREDSGEDASAETIEAHGGQLRLGAGLPHDTDTPDIETASEAYARRFAGEIGEWLLARQWQAVSDLLRTAGDGPLSILEIGGGHAQLAPSLLARGHDLVVQGSSAECFTRFHPLITAYPTRLALCVSDLWRLPFPDREFDVVLAVRLFGHVTRWEALIREMTRVSQRYVMVEFARAGSPLFAPLLEAVFALKRRMERATRPFFTYHEKTIVSALESAGLRVIAGVGQFAVPMLAHRFLGNPRLSARIERSLRMIGVGNSMRSPALLLAERSDGERASHCS